MNTTKKIMVFVCLLGLILFSGCDVRKKIEKLKDKGIEGIADLALIAQTDSSAFIRISAVYALSEINSIDIVDEVIVVYQDINSFLRENHSKIIDDYLSRTGMYSVDIDYISYAMREACMDAVFKKYVKRHGFYSKKNSEMIRPVYKARNVEHKDKIIEFLFSVMTSPSMPVVFDGGKGIRYRAAYLLQILEVRYVIPEMYQLLKEAADTQTKFEIAELIMKFGDVQYFPLDDDDKRELLSIRQELKILGKDGIS